MTKVNVNCIGHTALNVRLVICGELERLGNEVDV
jgi:hypothetical protein